MLGGGRVRWRMDGCLVAVVVGGYVLLVLLMQDAYARFKRNAGIYNGVGRCWMIVLFSQNE